jgi:hypothetical protein
MIAMIPPESSPLSNFRGTLKIPFSLNLSMKYIACLTMISTKIETNNAQPCEGHTFNVYNKILRFCS